VTRRAIAAGLIAALATTNALGSAVAATPTAAPTGYIVVLHDATDPESRTAQLERALGFSAKHRYATAIPGFAAKLTPVQVAALRADPRVAFVSIDGIVQTDALDALVPGELVPTGISRIGAASVSGLTAREASTAAVAVIDTGVDLTHPDLLALHGTNCVNPAAAAQDDNGHGTHVAGTIAANNAGAGVIGVSPGTSVYSVKVLDAMGSGSYSQVICGIDWVTANAAALGIRVANMSLGGGGSNDGNCGLTNSDALHLAICRSTAAGVTYVVAAGNSSADFSSSVPAAYPEVLTVTAMSDSDGSSGGSGGAPACRVSEQDDAAATFSNFARRNADASHTIAGPGVCIYSTWAGGSYRTMSGTSMATPHVSGAVALCVGTGAVAGPCAGLAPAQTIQLLRSDAQSRTTASSSYGFAGDPSHPQRGRKAYFGYLVSVAGY